MHARTQVNKSGSTNAYSFPWKDAKYFKHFSVYSNGRKSKYKPIRLLFPYVYTCLLKFKYTPFVLRISSTYVLKQIPYLNRIVRNEKVIPRIIIKFSFYQLQLSAIKLFGC